MIRKQIYIARRHQYAIRKLAEQQGISEAEVIRDAIDQQQLRRSQRPVDPDAWKRAMRLMRSLATTGRSRRGTARKWNREELYADRLARYERHPD